MIVSLFGVDLPSLMFKIFWHIKASRFHELGVGEDDDVRCIVLNSLITIRSLTENHMILQSKNHFRRKHSSNKNVTSDCQLDI